MKPHIVPDIYKPAQYMKLTYTSLSLSDGGIVAQIALPQNSKVAVDVG